MSMSLSDSSCCASSWASRTCSSSFERPVRPNCRRSALRWLNAFDPRPNRKYTTGPTPGARTMRNNQANVDCGDRFSSTRNTVAAARYDTYSAHESSAGMTSQQRLATRPAAQGRALTFGACWVTLVAVLLGWLAVARPTPVIAQAGGVAWAWSGAVTHDSATIVARLSTGVTEGRPIVNAGRGRAGPGFHP